MFSRSPRLSGKRRNQGEQPMKNGEKPKNAAPWGTLNWIATYPYSQMDRKRRKRAERAVGEETVKDILKGPTFCAAATELARICGKYGVTMTKSEERKLMKSLGYVLDLQLAVRDAAFGSALATAWGLRR